MTTDRSRIDRALGLSPEVAAAASRVATRLASQATDDDRQRVAAILQRSRPVLDHAAA